MNTKTYISATQYKLSAICEQVCKLISLHEKLCLMFTSEGKGEVNLSTR